MIQLITRIRDRLGRYRAVQRLLILAVIAGLLAIPYPLTISGDFEVITVVTSEVRTLTDGHLDKVTVGTGDRVASGDVVAHLLDTERRIAKTKLEAERAEAVAQYRLADRGFRIEEVNRARARHQELVAAVDLATNILERNKRLQGFGLVAAAELDQSQGDLDQKKQQLAQATEELHEKERGFRSEEIDEVWSRVEQRDAQIQEIERQLAWATVVTPVSGVVTTPDHEIQAQIGQYLPRGTAILKIVDPKTLVARIKIPESEFGDVALAQAVTLRTFQHPDRTFGGTVDKIEPLVRTDDASTFVPVLTGLGSADGALRLGSTGKAKISLGRRSFGYVLYRRLLRSVFVQIWSWT